MKKVALIGFASAVLRGKPWRFFAVKPFLPQSYAKKTRRAAKKIIR